MSDNKDNQALRDRVEKLEQERELWKELVDIQKNSQEVLIDQAGRHNGGSTDYIRLLEEENAKLRAEIKEYEQWFKQASANVSRMKLRERARFVAKYFNEVEGTNRKFEDVLNSLSIDKKYMIDVWYEEAKLHYGIEDED